MSKQKFGLGEQVIWGSKPIWYDKKVTIVGVTRHRTHEGVYELWYTIDTGDGEVTVGENDLKTIPKVLQSNTVEGVVHYARSNTGHLIRKSLRFYESKNPLDYSQIVETAGTPSIILNILDEPKYEGKKVRLTLEILDETVTD